MSRMSALEGIRSVSEELGGIVPVRCLVDDDMLGSGLEAVLDAAIAGY